MILIILVVLVVLNLDKKVEKEEENKTTEKEEMIEKEVRFTLPYETYQKLYYLSKVRQTTMDDLVTDLIDNSRIE